MSRAMKSLARPNAANEIAQEIFNFADQDNE
jgi:hypothetical protein